MRYSEPTEVPIVWSDGLATTTAATDPDGYDPQTLFALAQGAIEHAADPGDVVLTFDEATGLPTRIKLTQDAVDDRDYGFEIDIADGE